MLSYLKHFARVTVESLAVTGLFAGLFGAAFLATSALQGCGGGDISDELVDDVNYIETELDIAIDYDVHVGKLEGSTVGRCTKTPLGRFVIIDTKKIEERHLSKLLILLHEVGHCSFNFHHQKTQGDFESCTQHIMGQGYKNIKCEKNFDKYVQQIKVAI